MTAVSVPAGWSRGAAVRVRRLVVPRDRADWMDRGLLAAIAALTFALYAWALSANEYGNTYYAAAVRSMTVSWRNFFFGAFDPGGFITVDKPPVFLWFGALSARVFGYSSWSILLPSAVAGMLSASLLWLIVRRSFGPLPATVAGLVLAFTPIVVAVNRLNLPEPFMLLFLVAAAGCVLRSIESGGRWWAWTLGAGALVGVAFNTKMLAAWIPGPAFALALVAGLAAWRSWRAWAPRLALQLALLAGATFAISASWMLIADAWPASARPYIGGSSDNSVYNLIVDYNGLGRVEGEGQGGPPPNNRPGATPNGQPGAFPGGAGNRGAGNAPGANRGPVPGNGAGGIIAGSPGLWRMLDDANGPQIAWFLPLAFGGALVAAWQWRRDPARRGAIVLWLGWTLLYGGVFSFAQGIYHSYYTSALAPGVAAMTGIGIAAMAGMVRRHRAWLAAPAVLVAATAWLQLDLAGRLQDHLSSLPNVAIAVLAAGALAALGLAAWRPAARYAAASVPLLAAGLLVIPAGWSFYEARHPSMNTTLPQAGARQGAAARSFGSQAFDQGTSSLAAWLETHRQPDARWDLVVTSAQNASLLVAAYDLSVVPLGGFSGRDPTITVAEFADLVAKGDARYVLAGGAGPGGAINGVAFGGGRGGQPGTGGIGVPFVPGGTGRLPVAPNGGNGFGPQGRTGPNGSRGIQPGFAPSPGQGVPGQGQAAGTSARGANAVMRAVETVCTPLQSNDVPGQYRGSLFDCAGKADALRSAG